MGIVHNKLQLDNLLVFSEEPIGIKLTGFEFCSDGEPLLPSLSACLAPEIWEREYKNGVAPRIWEEILANRGYSDKRPKPSCGSPVDIWSAGVICSQLTLKSTPCYLFRDKSRDEQAADYVDLLLAVRSQSSTERSEAWAQKLGLSATIPRLLLSFLQKLLDPEPQSRAKAGDCLRRSLLVSVEG